MSELSSDAARAIAIAEHIVRTEENRNFDVEMTADFASILLAYVQVAQAHMIGFQKNGYPNENTNVWSLVHRFKEAIPHEQRYEEVSIKVSLNFRDVDFIGRIMWPRGKKTDPLFMKLNGAFVKAGGEDNAELRDDFERRIKGDGSVG